MKAFELLQELAGQIGDVGDIDCGIEIRVLVNGSIVFAKIEGLEYSEENKQIEITTEGIEIDV